jgi:hypothetical protein
MTDLAVKIAKLNDNRYEISLEGEHAVLNCFVRAKLAGDATASEAETRQLALTRARALANALLAASLQS